jgi:energy-coupling factor transporter ATP-binding protein EcfA2
MLLSQTPRLLLNLHGRSGLGKTALQKMVSGIWGPPDAGNITANSTTNSIRSEVIACRDVPVVIDEITPAVSDVLDLVYENGADRKRVTPLGGATGTPMPDWTGLIITSSNNSLITHAKARAPSQTEAILARSLEVPIAAATLPPASVAEVNRVHGTSAGWLGDYWANELVRWDMGLAKQMLGLRERVWRSGGHIKAVPPAARMWMSFFAVMEYTASQLAQAPFAQHIDWVGMWNAELKQVCYDLYDHNIKAGGSVTVRDKLLGIAADLREWEIDETSGPPHPIGIQVQRGNDPKCRRALDNGRVVWSVHQTLLESYMRRNASHASYDAQALVDEAFQAGALIVPQGALTHMTMQRLGAGVPAPCYQFYLS